MLRFIKRGITALLLCCFIGSLGAISALAWTALDYQGFSYNPATGLIVSYMSSRSPTGTSLIIPSQINGITIVGIMGTPLSESRDITSITIPDTFTSIAADSFCDDTAVTDITIPSNVTSIGADIFHGCDKSKITIHASSDSAAAVYAKAYGIAFASTDPPASSSSSAADSSSSADSASSNAAATSSDTFSTAVAIGTSSSSVTSSGTSSAVSGASSAESDLTGSAANVNATNLSLRSYKDVSPSSQQPQTLLIIIGIGVIITGAVTSFLMIKFKMFHKEKIK